MKSVVSRIDHPEVAIEVDCNAAWVVHLQCTSGHVGSFGGRNAIREGDLLHRSPVLICHPSIAISVEHHVSRTGEGVRSAVVHDLSRWNSAGDRHLLDSAGGNDPEVPQGVECESPRTVEVGWGHRPVGSIRSGNSSGKGDLHDRVVELIGDPEVPVGIEGQASWTVETRKDIGGKCGRNTAWERDLGDRPAQVIREPEIALAVEDQSVRLVEANRSVRVRTVSSCAGCPCVVRGGQET